MKIKIVVLFMIGVLLFTACSYTPSASQIDMANTVAAGNTLQERQPTPTDIEYSLERYNLIRRAYWVNGQREKARTFPSPISDMPLGYAVLVDAGVIIGRFVVEGKVSSLNSFLTPDSQYYEYSGGEYRAYNNWLPDIDGSYGTNSEGAFFFTPDGKYIEWTGKILYSDIPFELESPSLILEVD